MSSGRTMTTKDEQAREKDREAIGKKLDEMQTIKLTDYAAAKALITLAQQKPDGHEETYGELAALNLNGRKLLNCQIAQAYAFAALQVSKSLGDPTAGHKATTNEIRTALKEFEQKPTNEKKQQAMLVMGALSEKIMGMEAYHAKNNESKIIPAQEMKELKTDAVNETARKAVAPVVQGSFRDYAGTGKTNEFRHDSSARERALKIGATTDPFKQQPGVTVVESPLHRLPAQSSAIIRTSTVSSGNHDI